MKSKGNQHLEEIKKIELKREERRVKMQQAKREKQDKRNYNIASGKNVDIDFELMIEKNKFTEKMLSKHISSTELKLAVCVRKRPLFKKEEQNGEIDSISCANPQIKVHEPKYKVDGITKYVENHTFTFDNTFNEVEDTDDIYNVALKPLIPLLVAQGVVTCFAYGQTGSGKTYTMNGLQDLIVRELFEVVMKNFVVFVSYFEIYGGKCLDLLNEKNVLNILEDKANSIQIPELTERSAENSKELLQIMHQANSNRTTHSTTANDTSSRSHAICQILVRRANEDIGSKLVLVDLAGSQRAQDTQSNNRQRRMQGAEINKSLLALKECIRAMDDKADHVPFRASKLTLILRDSFISKSTVSKIVMIACVNPGSSSADHSLNTLRYADRLKDQTELSKKYNDLNEASRKIHQNEPTAHHIKKEVQRDNIQKIESLKSMKKQQKPQKHTKAIKSQVKNLIENKSGGNLKMVTNNQQSVNHIVGNGNNAGNKANNQLWIEVKTQQHHPSIKVPTRNVVSNISVTHNSNHKNNQPQTHQKDAMTKIDKQSKDQVKDRNRATSVKKAPIVARGSKQFVKQASKIEQEIEIEDIIVQQQQKKKVKDDISAMKRTMKSQNKQQFFAFQEKVSSILQQQQQVFMTHMAAIREDAKLLTMQSELISHIQGVGFMDYDVDSYVQKLQMVIKRKLKMYDVLCKKVDNFKKYLKEQDQIRHKVKNVNYY